MFHSEPLLAAVLADRHREFARVARDRQLIGFEQPQASEPQRRTATIAHGSRPVVGRPTGAGGAAL